MGQRAVGTHPQGVDRVRGLVGHDQCRTRRGESHLRRAGAGGGQGAMPVGDPRQTVRRDPEAGDRAVAGVQHVDPVPACGHADRLAASAPDHLLAPDMISGHPQHRQCVAAGVDGVQMAAVRAERERALGGEVHAGAMPAGADRPDPVQAPARSSVEHDHTVPCGRVRKCEGGVRLSRLGPRCPRHRGHRSERERQRQNPPFVHDLPPTSRCLPRMDAPHAVTVGRRSVRRFRDPYELRNRPVDSSRSLCSAARSTKG